jgi:predicted phosphodiesterase
MKILALGDTHFPFHHKKALEWTYRLADKLKPTHVIQLGDLLDQFAFSRYPKVLKLDPEKELALGRVAAEKMWSHFKGLPCYQLMGNHDDRALKKALAAAPELASLVGKSLRELYSFPGVRTVLDGREELILGGIAFQHGHRSRLGDHARFNRISTCVGHSHTGGVVFLRDARRVFWELNAGFLGDVSSPAFGYVAQKRFHTTTVGVGIIDDLGPRFCPYPG